MPHVTTTELLRRSKPLKGNAETLHYSIKSEMFAYLYCLYGMSCICELKSVSNFESMPSIQLQMVINANRRYERYILATYSMSHLHRDSLCTLVKPHIDYKVDHEPLSC